MTNEAKKSAYARMGDKLAQFGLASPAVSEARDIETITSEILSLKKTAGDAILAIGHRLIEAKSLLAHGEWLPWLTEQVEFSERSAQTYMRLAREWSNPQTLADLGAAKVLVLLSLPELEREAFLAEVPAEDMSVRELKKAIRERNEAQQAQEKMAGDLRLANELLERARTDQETERARYEQASEMLKMNADLLKKAKEEKQQAAASAAELEQQLKELREKPVEVAVMEVDQETLAAARAEAVEEMQAKIDRARKDLAAANDRIASLEQAARAAAVVSDEDLTICKILFGQAQEIVNKMAGLRIKLQGREDPSAAESVRRAMLALSDKIRRDAE